MQGKTQRVGSQQISSDCSMTSQVTFIYYLLRNRFVLRIGSSWHHKYL